MNPYVLNGLTISYMEDFLGEVKHLKNHIIVKCYSAKTGYGSILKIKVYRYVKGSWERYSHQVLRVKCETDLAILQGTFHHYQSVLQYMYEDMNLIQTNSSDTE